MDEDKQDAEAGPGPAGAREAPAFVPPATQADLDRIIQERVARAKPADYEDLRRAADELKALKDAQLTEAEKLQAERDDLKAKLDRLQAEAEAARLRAEVAAAKRLPPGSDKLLSGSTREDLEASADLILGLVAEAAKGEPVKPVPSQGRTSSGGADASAQEARARYAQRYQKT
jgi:hypothetical protein